MKAELKDGNLVITIPFDKEGTVSQSGKSLIHASTHGNQAVSVGGKVLNVGVNVYSKK